eukprot:3337355-Pyramimonas_sp.AAC.1
MTDQSDTEGHCHSRLSLRQALGFDTDTAEWTVMTLLGPYYLITGEFTCPVNALTSVKCPRQALPGLER